MYNAATLGLTSMMMNIMAKIPVTESMTTSLSGTWSVGEFLKGATTTIEGWGSSLVTLIGVVMLVSSIVMMAKGFMSGGRSQTNWLVIGVMFLLGGALVAGGYGFMRNLAKGGEKTINDLGKGVKGDGLTILPAVEYLKIKYMMFK